MFFFWDQGSIDFRIQIRANALRSVLRALGNHSIIIQEGQPTLLFTTVELPLADHIDDALNEFRAFDRDYRYGIIPTAKGYAVRCRAEFESAYMRHTFTCGGWEHAPDRTNHLCHMAAMVHAVCRTLRGHADCGVHGMRSGVWPIVAPQ